MESTKMLDLHEKKDLQDALSRHSESRMCWFRWDIRCIKRQAVLSLRYIDGHFNTTKVDPRGEPQIQLEDNTI